MTAWLGALFLVAGFAGLCWMLRLVPATRRVLSVLEEAFAIVGNRDLDDDTKEALTRRQAMQSLLLFAWIAGGSLVAAAVPFALLWGADRWHWLAFPAVLEVAMSWPFITATLIAALAAAGWKRRHRRLANVRAGRFENRYSAVDRLMHQVAFATPGVQVAAARLEDRLHRRRLAGIAVQRPVFIAALPRAGTTLLLEICASLDEFVTHTYRAMPFVLTPLLWARLTRPFRVNPPPQERAHGDGMMVSPDSPEAFEEVLWLTFWYGHYAADRIAPWRDGETARGFSAFFHQHIRKLIMADRTGRTRPAGRYVSKNNLNIARVPALLSLFPDALVLIPFRDPLQHAASLLRQHRNFLDIHARDVFARRYMAAIGHFDFGANLRPVNFDGWLASAAEPPTALAFWVRYWTATYHHLLNLRDERVAFFDFDAGCAAPAAGLGALAEFLQLDDRPAFVSQHTRVHPPKPHPVDEASVAPAVRQAAHNVHAELVARALARPAATRTPSGPAAAGHRR